MKTLMGIIMDRSGSMQNKEADVVGGVNTFIVEQQALPGEAWLTMVRFDDVYENFRPVLPLKDVLPLAMGEYQPRGSTALLDAIGRTLVLCDSLWLQYQPERAIIVIATDGFENASREYSKEQIKQMVEAREASKLWSFIYLSADINAFADAASYGIPMGNTANYTNTGKGTRAVYMAASTSVASMRATGTMDANLGGIVGEDRDDIVSVQPAAPVPPTVTVAPGASAPPAAPIWIPPQSTPGTWVPPNTAA